MYDSRVKRNFEAIRKSNTYLRAYEDVDFLHREELRPVRLQLELLKPTLIQDEQKIVSTVVVFGSTRIVEAKDAEQKVKMLEHKLNERPNDTLLLRELEICRRLQAKAKYYDGARTFARIVAKLFKKSDKCEFAIVTGGGPGIMEAANRGAFEQGVKTIGLNITLPFEQFPNPYITPELCFQFHYFALRKMQFLMRAKAMVAFPGGYGTLDELFEALVLVQTYKIPPMPVILYGGEYWSKLINFQHLVDEGTISPEDIYLFQYAESPQEAWNIIADFYGLPTVAGPKGSMARVVKARKAVSPGKAVSTVAKRSRGRNSRKGK